MALVQAFLNENTGFWESLDMGNTDDSGGPASAKKIQNGAIGVVLPPIANIEEVATGSVTSRQIHAGISTQDDATAYRCLVFVSKPYADPLINAFLISLGDSPMTWIEARAKIEEFSSITGKTSIYVPYDVYAGMGTITLMSRIGVTPMKSGNIYALKQDDIVEFISIKSLVAEQKEFEITVNGAARLENRIVYTCELIYPLEHDFTGFGIDIFDNTQGPAFIYQTQSNPRIHFNGIMRVTEPVQAFTNVVSVDTIMQTIIPSSRVETGFLPKNPTYQVSGLFDSGKGLVGFYIPIGGTKQVGTFSPIFPGSFRSTTPLPGTTDDGNGGLMLNGKKIGTINYSQGRAEIDPASNINFLNPVIKFEPATLLSQHPYSIAIPLSFSSTRRVFEIDIEPPPQSGSISFEYQWGGKVYTLIDNGNGKLLGDDEAYGIGVFDHANNHLSVNLRYAPDADSAALVKWTTNAALVNRSTVSVPPMTYPIDMASLGFDGGLTNGAVNFSWYGVSGNHYTATADVLSGGVITGDATGLINSTVVPGGTANPDSFVWVIAFTPNLTLAAGTELTIQVVDYSSYNSQQTNFLSLFPQLDGLIHIDLTFDIPALFHIDHETIEVTFNAYITYGDDDSTTGKQEYEARVTYNQVGTGLDFTQSINWVSDTEIKFSPKTFVTIPVPHYGRNSHGTSVVDSYLMQQKPSSVSTSGLSGFVKFRLIPNGTETFTRTVVAVLDNPIIKFTFGFNESMVPGGLRFKIGRSIFFDRDGFIYSIPDAYYTGSEAIAGTPDYQNSRVQLSAWPSEASNAISVESLATYFGGTGALISEVSFYSEDRPLIPGSVSITVGMALGGVLSIIPDETQVINVENCQGTANFSTGLFNLKFGNWRTVASLTLTETSEWWYSESNIVDGKIWKPVMVFPQSLRISGTAFTLIPSSRTRLGVNPALFPQSGLAPAVKVGDLIVLHDEKETPISEPITPGMQVQLRDKLAYASLLDAAGNSVLSGPTTYSIDLKTGVLAFSTNLNLSAYNPPYTVIHKRAEPREVSGIDISGKVSVIPPFSQDFEAGSYLSTAVEFGNIQALVPSGRMFSQATWSLSNPIWSDTRIGSEPLLQFNRLSGYKIAVTNEGAITQRWALYFPSALPEFICYGEDIGRINDNPHPLNLDFAPINPASKTPENPDGVPYFVFPANALSGQGTGNVFFFTTLGSKKPIWVVRVISPSDTPPAAETRDFSLIFLCHPDKKEQ